MKVFQSWLNNCWLCTLWQYTCIARDYGRTQWLIHMQLVMKVFVKGYSLRVLKDTSIETYERDHNLLLEKAHA